MQKETQLTLFLVYLGTAGGTQVSSIVAAVCLFVAQELVGPLERVRDKDRQTHTHTQST